MKKDMIRTGIALGILLVLYHLLAFMIPFEKTAAFWISYGFTLAAFAVVLASVYIAFLRKGDAKSRFYGFPIARIGIIYGAAQLVVGFLFMALGTYIAWWVAVLVYSVGLGAALIGLVGAEAVVDEIHVQDEKLKKDVTVMRTLQSKVNQMAVNCDAPELKQFAEELRYSDPVSSEALFEAEQDLSAVVDELQQAVIDGDSAAVGQLCRRASAMLAERNRLCRLHK